MIASPSFDSAAGWQAVPPGRLLPSGIGGSADLHLKGRGLTTLPANLGGLSMKLVDSLSECADFPSGGFSQSSADDLDPDDSPVTAAAIWHLAVTWPGLYTVCARAGPGSWQPVPPVVEVSGVVSSSRPPSPAGTIGGPITIIVSYPVVPSIVLDLQ